jgi:spectinomycin phosphotransferase
MSRKPNPSGPSIFDWAQQNHSLSLTHLEPLNLGYDPTASVYKLEASQQTFFLKLRSGPLNPISLTIPHLLKQNGIEQVIAPLETTTGQLSSLLDRFGAVLYPFITGDSAMRVGMNRQQWLEFGQTLKQVHSPEIAQQAAELVPCETFDIASFAKVLEVQQALQTHPLEHPAQQKLAAFWEEKRELIHYVGERAKRLGEQLQKMQLEFVLCHSDIHAANLMVSGEHIYLVDWDSPLLAPIERDLLFVIQSPIARQVSPEEEAWFFEGYGALEVKPSALAYFRYERAIQDIGEFGYGLLFDTGRSEAELTFDLRMLMQQFAKGDVLQLAMAIDPEQP